MHSTVSSLVIGVEYCTARSSANWKLCIVIEEPCRIWSCFEHLGPDEPCFMVLFSLTSRPVSKLYEEICPPVWGKTINLLCTIWGFYGIDYEEYRLLGCGAVCEPTFRRNISSPSSTLKIEAIRSSETSVHTRSTRRHIPEDGILQLIYYFL
jgi:hypothetical protein